MNTILYIPKVHSAAADVSEDVSLPDYVPEVRRVVGVRAAASVDGKYMAGDAMETDGSVTYTVLYTGGDGNLAQFSQTTPYTGRIPMPDEIPPADVVVSASPEQVGCRVTAPRKITLSSRVKLNAAAQQKKDIAVKTPEQKKVRRKTELCSTAAVTEVRGTGEAAGEIREKEGTKVIMASAEMAISDVRMGAPAGKITVKGDVYLTLLAKTGDGGSVTSRSRCPVEEILPMPDGADAGNCRGAAFGTIVLIEVDAGEDGVMQWRTEYDIDCAVMEMKQAEITEDAYLVGCTDELTRENVEVCTPAGCVNGRLTASAAAKLRPGMEFVCAWGTVTGERCAVKDGKLIVEGVIKLECVTAGEGETVTDDVQIPLKYECEAVHDAENCDSLSGKVKAAVTDVTARADGDQLNLTAELAISAAVLGRKNITAVTSVAAGAPVPEKKNLLRIYVPDGDETAWDVEKRFRLGEEVTPDGALYVI